MPSILQNLLTVPHAALAADLDFRKANGDPMVAFIIEDDGDLNTQLATALGRMGVACIIDLVDGRCDAPDAYPVVLAPISIVVEISENVTMNRRGTEFLTLREVLEMVLDKLQLNYGLTLSSFRSVPPPKGADAAYQIYLETLETLENTRN